MLFNFTQRRMYKRFVNVISLFGITISCFAQHTQNAIPLNISDIPQPTASMPSWAKLMYEKHPNVYKVDSAYEAYYKQRTFTKDNYTRYYKRWKKAMEGHFDAKGNIIQEPFIGEMTPPKPSVNSNERGVLAGNWSCIGPKETIWLKDDNAAQTAAPWQTNIYSFDIAPSDANTLYAGTETAGVFKSTDKGLNWVSVCDNTLLRGAVTAVAIHPTDPNTVYIAAGNDIQKTTNGGASWTTIYTYSNLSANDIAISPADPNIVLLASDQGFFRSTNGSSFSRTLTQSCYDIEYNTANNTTVYILLKKTGTTSFSEVYKSTDDGATFTVKNVGWISKTEGEGRLAVTAADPNTMYAVLLTENGPAVLKTTDGAENWIEVGHGAMDNGQGYYDLGIAVSATNAQHIIVGSTTAYKSTDGGATYTAVGGYTGNFNIHPDIQEIKVSGSDTWIATDGGMNYSSDFFTNTSNWTPRFKGITGADFWGFSQGWHEDFIVGGRYHNGNTAMHENYPAGLALRMGGAESGTGYVMLGRTRHVKYSDLGDGWIVPPTAYSNSEGRFAFSKTPNEDGYGFNAGEVEFDPRCYKHVYVTEGNSLWKSTDGGISFTALYTFSGKAFRFEISRQNPDVIYVQTDNGIFKSTNGGVAFTAINTSMITNWYRVQIALNPLNDTELWVTCPDCSASNKVFKSTNSGASWTNLTTSTINGYRTVNLVHQVGSNGGVYIGCDKRTSSNLPAKIFYRDNTLSDWVDFSTNFPQSFEFLKSLPFYKNGVLRASGNRGVWESPFYTPNPSTVHVQPTVDKLISLCSRDTFYFDDFSITSGTATYSWSFSPTPQYVSNTSTRNPKVYFGNSGTYTATLTVNGVTAATPLNITVGNACNPDTIPGNCIALDGTAYTYAVQDKAMNLNSNTLTFTAWVKRNGTQADFSGIFMARGGSTTAGLNIKSNNELAIHWDGNGWWWNSGLILPDNIWSHIAMVVSPTNIKLYLNGKVSTYTATIPVEAFDTPIKLGTDRSYDRNFKGWIDEFAVYNYALSQNEIRESMHLTKPTGTTGLLAYYQTNEASGIVLDKIGNNHIAFASAGATRSTSTAPIGKGTANRQIVTAGGNYTFSGTGLKLKFPASGTFPNGELCVTRLNQSPETKANTSASNIYWIVNNFGTNTTFTALDSLGFENVGIGTNGTLPTQFQLFKRGTFDEGNTWGNPQATATALTVSNAGSLGFGVGNGVTSFSQFSVANANIALDIQWLDFNVIAQNEKEVKLIWKIEQTQSKFFTIVRSSDGIHFEKIGQVYSHPKDGIYTYQFTDNTIKEGIYYYKIVNTNTDDSENESIVKSVMINNPSDAFMLFPNPSSEQQHIFIKTSFEDDFVIKIHNMDGKELYRSLHSKTLNEIPINFSKGIYFYQMTSATRKFNGKFIIQ